MNILLKSSLVLTIIGGLNWGLVAIFNFNLVEYLFRAGSMLTNLVYILVFISALVDLIILTKNLDK